VEDSAGDLAGQNSLFFKVAELFAAETPIVCSVVYAYGAADIQIRAASRVHQERGKLARMLAPSEKCLRGWRAK
jgi:hypothetical protein